MAATCSQCLQLGCQLPQEGSGESLSIDLLRAEYSSELCRVLESFNNEHTRALYSLESTANSCTELLNRTSSAAETDTCRMQLECSMDSNRFPPVITSGRCLNNYCSAGQGRHYPCRPQRKRVLVLRYFGEDSNAASIPSFTEPRTGHWRLRRERVVTDCYCAVPRYP